MNRESVREQEIGDRYIKGHDKFPIDERRWGFLPMIMQNFLGEYSVHCQTSKTNTALKSGHKCLLRFGVENNPMQSFVACISSTLFYTEVGKNNIMKSKQIFPNTSREIPSISEMKLLLSNLLTIDNFLTFQNGTLVSQFYDKEIIVSLSDYTDSKLFKNIRNQKAHNLDQDDGEEKEGEQEQNEQQLKFVKRVAAALIKFKSYLADPDVMIDHSYLWDIVTAPNSRLFRNGLNLAIFEIPENDLTANVALLCPTNAYSSLKYSPDKPTLILLKRDNYYEPIYEYTNKTSSKTLKKLFSENDPNITPNMRKLLKTIVGPILINNCKPSPSMPKVYKFRAPSPLNTIIKHAIKQNYKAITQVLNMSGKVVGITVITETGIRGYIPCLPSALTTLTEEQCTPNSNKSKCNYPFTYINSDDIWSDYDNTVEFLKTHYNYDDSTADTSNKKCNHKSTICRVVDNEMVVGFLTSTNQFVKIDPPLPNSEATDMFHEVTSGDHIAADISNTFTETTDSERELYINKISLETKLYNAFRNTVRILLGDYVNSNTRKNILAICENKFIEYNTKLDTIMKYIRSISEASIKFVDGNSDEFIQTTKTVDMCVSESDEKTCTDLSPLCAHINNKCVILIPKENLITGSNNEVKYYIKLADELIRYTKIRSFFFKPKSFLLFGTVGYNMLENEIIISQSLLVQDFFDNIIQTELNKYVKHNDYDTTDPFISQLYNPVAKPASIMDMDKIDNVEPVLQGQFATSDEPIIASHEKIIDDYWNECFPDSYRQIQFNDGFQMIITLLNEYHQNNKITVSNMKDELLSSNVVTANDSTILNDAYKLTEDELKLFAVKYKLPIILLQMNIQLKNKLKSRDFQVLFFNAETGTVTESKIPKVIFVIHDNVKNVYWVIINSGKNIINRLSAHSFKSSICLERINTAINNYSIDNENNVPDEESSSVVVETSVAEQRDPIHSTPKHTAKAKSVSKSSTKKTRKNIIKKLMFVK